MAVNGGHAGTKEKGLNWGHVTFLWGTFRLLPLAAAIEFPWLRVWA